MMTWGSTWVLSNNNNNNNNNNNQARGSCTWVQSKPTGREGRAHQDEGSTCALNMVIMIMVTKIIILTRMTMMKTMMMMMMRMRMMTMHQFAVATTTLPPARRQPYVESTDSVKALKNRLKPKGKYFQANKNQRNPKKSYQANKNQLEPQERRQWDRSQG